MHIDCSAALPIFAVLLRASHRAALGRRIQRLPVPTQNQQPDNIGDAIHRDRN